MRVLRAKSVRKHLKFFKLVFGITPPYNVIVDGNFIFAAVKYKIDVRDRLQKLLQADEVKLYVLKSVLKELKLVGAKADAALNFAKTRCEIIDDDAHNGETPSDNLVRVLESVHRDSSPRKKRYMVATQDQDLRRTLAQIPGVPLIYLNMVTLVLEAPSQSSLSHNRTLEVSKAALNAEESEMLTSLSAKKKRKRTEDAEDEGSDAEASPARPTPHAAPTSSSTTGGSSRLTTALAPGVAVVSRKKHRAHAPNPLSNAKASADSHNSQKKKERKFRKFY